MKWMKATLWFWLTMATTAVAFSVGQEIKLPEGEGKEIVAGKCTICHSLDRIVDTHATAAGWEGIVKEMVSEGAPLENDEIPVVVNYLAKNFGPTN